MKAYIAKRLLLAGPVVFGVSVIVFLAVRLAPGDAATVLAGMEPTEEVIAAIRAQYGLDRPIWEQYVSFLSDLARLDLGRSTSTRLPVTEELARRIPVTATIAVGATVLATLIGVTLGTIAARFQRTWLDYSVMVAALGALSVPNYVVGLLFILVFAVGLGLLPATGASSPKHFILPIVTVGLVGAGVLARQTRSAVLDVLEQDYVRTARAKGLGEQIVLTRHALRNALIPIITVIGLLFGQLLAGTVIVETVFSIPGVGKYMIDRIFQRDYPAVQGGVLLIASTYVFVNLLIDLAYIAIDKRIRYT